MRQAELLRSLAQDLQAPVENIASYAEILASLHEQPRDDAKLSEYHAILLANARVLQRRVADLRLVTEQVGVQALHEQAIDLAELLQAAVEELRGEAAARSVSVVLHVIEDVQLVGELSRLRRLLVRLFSEAISAARPGAVVSANMQQMGDFALSITLQLADGWNPQVAPIMHIVEEHGGALAMGDACTLRLILPASRLIWPRKT